jgi:hypothetical protein
MLDVSVIVKVTDVPVPEAGTVPVPAQPVQTYWVPVGPAVGEVIDSVISVPESNQPLDGFGEPCADVTVK